MSVQWRLRDMLAPKIGSFRFGRQWHLAPKRQTIFVPDDEKAWWVKKEEQEDGKVVVRERVEIWFTGLEL